MAEYDLLVKGGTVGTAADTFAAEIAIKDGKIVALLDEAATNLADDVIDATGKLVLPGGIEGHCHIDEPSFGEAKLADDFLSGSWGAACGGTTTIIPFAQQIAGMSLREAVDDYHAKASGKSIVDYGFHLILSNPTDQVLGQELPALIADGYTSFKVYMTYDGLRLEDMQILEVLSTAKTHDGLVMIHCENDHCITWLAEQLDRRGEVGAASMGVAHGPAAEREATHRAITLSEVVDTPVFIVHVSSHQAMDQIAWARSRGMPIYAETCPQYLFLSSDDYSQPGWEGAKYICSPPPRDPENPAHLWRGIQNSIFQLVSSDHCPYSMEGPGGRKQSAGELHFHKISPGMPGIETRLPLMFSEGVMKGRIDLQTFVAVTATNAAKLYGLHPRKGTIAVGSDADLVLWDPEREVVLTNDDLHGNCDYSPYEGRHITGWPVLSMSRGVVLCRDGKVVAPKGHGTFLHRGTSSAVKKAA